MITLSKVSKKGVGGGRPWGSWEFVESLKVLFTHKCLHHLHSTYSLMLLRQHPSNKSEKCQMIFQIVLCYVGFLDSWQEEEEELVVYWITDLLLVFGLPTVKSSHVATYISDKIDIEVFYLKQLFNLEFFSRRFVSLLIYYPELPMWFRGKNICIFVLVQCYVDFSVQNDTYPSNILTVCNNSFQSYGRLFLHMNIE